MNNITRNKYFLVIALVIVLCLLFYFFSSKNPEVPIGELSNQIAQGQLKRITVQGDDLVITYRDEQRGKAKSTKEPGVSLFDTLHGAGLTAEQIKDVEISVVSPWAHWYELFAVFALWLIAIFIIAVFFITRATRPSQLDQFKLTLDRDPETVKTTFDDLGGISEIEKTLAPVIEWLRYPKDNLATEVPRGVLITGPSGCGKTLLARAIAGTASIPLFSYSCSEFIELFVGVGASRMRDVFATVRKKANSEVPCIIFFDHIDLIGAERSAARLPILGSEAEENKALVQLLAELDNLNMNGRIYVLATTSRPRVLDPALLAQGRLSLCIDLPLPDKHARREILEKHTRFHSLSNDVDLDRIAGGTQSFSGSELAQLVYWAAEFAKKRAANGIEQAPESQIKVELCLEDFVLAKAQILPQPSQQLPKQIVEHLNKYVQGQDIAKKRLAVAVSNHYLRLSLATRFTSLPDEIKKSNVLLIGPTGTGKTMLIETIASYLDVPYVILNSTILTETGYPGANVEQMLYELLVVANLNKRKAEYGIICIDEFDKLAFSQGERTRHTGIGVQQDLLKLVEGTVVDVPKSGTRYHGTNLESYQFDTSNILFVCLGAFNSLDVIIGQRLQESLRPDKTRPELLKYAQPQDIINYGFIPELIGRFPVITTTEILTVDQLAKILTNPYNGLEREYKSLLKMQGWEDPTFKGEAIERIAEEALHRQVGARGLRAIMEEVLLEKMYGRPTNGMNPEEKSPEADSLQPAMQPISLVINDTWVTSALSAVQPPLNQNVDLTVEQIVEKLDGQLPGNARVKQLLAVLSQQHYRSLANESGSDLPTKGKLTFFTDQSLRKAVLLIDPYLRLRQLLVQTLAEIWGVPCTVIRADMLERSLNSRSAQGNAWLFEPVRDLLEKSAYDLHKAQQGIIFIDDFDLAVSRVTVDPYYSTLAQRLIAILQGQPVSLQTPHGQTIEFATRHLFLILGGDFRFTNNLSTPFSEDHSLHTKYEPASIFTHLQANFNLSSDLLRLLIIIVMDFSIAESDLEQIIKKYDEQVHQKYASLLDNYNISLSRSAEDYAQLARQARDENWAPSEIGIKLESELLTLIYKYGENHANV